MNDKIDIEQYKIFKNVDEENEFINTMNIRFSVVKNLMDKLITEIHNEDEKIKIKTTVCAIKLLKCLDNFVEEMRLLMFENKDCESSH